MRIGIDLGGTKIEGLALDDAGSERARRRVATPAGGYRATVEAIAALVLDLEHATGSAATVGIGIPGAVSPATGLVKNANSTCLIGRALDRDLAEALARPVRLANDANCFALSEATDGSAAGRPVVFGVILGTGVGGGVVVDGRVLTGPNAIAGEWGHNPLPAPRDDERPGIACYCGRAGCIETFLSGPGFSADHRSRTGQSLNATEIAMLAESGNTAARASMECYEDRLARALASVINLLDPDAIVLGGGLSNITRLYREIPRLWQRYVFSDHVSTALLPPRFGDASGVRGAAWLWPHGSA
jgi:fructokinase